MVKMKITGTRSYVVLDIDGWKIKVKGEFIIGGFIAKKESMRKFESPYDNVDLTDAIKIRYIDEAVMKTANSHMVIKFT